MGGGWTRHRDPRAQLPPTGQGRTGSERAGGLPEATQRQSQARVLSLPAWGGAGYSPLPRAPLTPLWPPGSPAAPTGPPGHRSARPAEGRPGHHRGRAVGAHRGAEHGREGAAPRPELHRAPRAPRRRPPAQGQGHVAVGRPQGGHGQRGGHGGAVRAGESPPPNAGPGQNQAGTLTWAGAERGPPGLQLRPRGPGKPLASHEGPRHFGGRVCPVLGRRPPSPLHRRPRRWLLPAGGHSARAGGSGRPRPGLRRLPGPSSPGCP